MEREIKFRAWDNQAKKMSTAFNPLIGEKPTIYGEPIYSIDSDYMQFTGLQDIKGKDIYEGDILCVPHLEGTRHKVRMVIEWNNDNAEFTKYNPKNAFEIIGNIYENSELLNSQK